MSKVEQTRGSCEDVFQDTQDFSGAIYFHALKADAPHARQTSELNQD